MLRQSKDRVECKVRRKFFADEQMWQTHYVDRHSDTKLFNQYLRRLLNWNTAHTSVEEVEQAVEVVYTIGERLGIKKRPIEETILNATKVAGITSYVDDWHDKNPDRDRETVDVNSSSATRHGASQGSTNRPVEPQRPARAPKLAELSQKLIAKAQEGTIYDKQRSKIKPEDDKGDDKRQQPEKRKEVEKKKNKKKQKWWM